MSAKGAQAAESELQKLLAVETAVLRALCLSINAPGSALTDRILETLSANAFYFPINKALFAVLSEMHKTGDYVVCSNLEEELRKHEVGIPEGFYLEDLFRGDLPKLPEVSSWLERLKERAGKGQPAAPGGATEPQPTAPAASRSPSAPPAKTEAVPVPAGRKGGPDLDRPLKPVRPARTDSAEEKPRQAAPAQLSSEGEEWTSYLQEVAAKQGKILETGFIGLDEGLGGLCPSLMLVVDQDAGRLSGFLKQLTDQVAARMKVPCLYVSFGPQKAALRIRTLARLSGVPARDIERGRIKKGSAEWAQVDQTGRAAAEWLQWVFVVEAEPEMDCRQIADTGRRLLESSGATTCLVVVDSLDHMGKGGESLPSVVADLKAISESLDVLVIAATAKKSLMSEPGVDLLGTLGEERGTAQLEIIRIEDSHATTVRFEYHPDIWRFVERREPA